MKYIELIMQWNIISIFIILFISTGCMSTRQGISIIDINEGKMSIKKCRGPYVEYPFCYNSDKSTFYTLQNVGDNKLRFREIDYKGNTLYTKILPFFEDYYVSSWYALSPDANKIIYFDDTAKALKVLYIDTIKHNIVATNIISYVTNIRYIKWISNDQIIIAYFNINISDHVEDTVEIINTNTKKRTIIHESYRKFEYEHCLSPTKRYFLFCSDGETRYDEYMYVYDIKNSKIITNKIHVDKHKYKSNIVDEISIRSVEFSVNDKYIAYVLKEYMDNEKEYRSIIRMSINGDEESVLTNNIVSEYLFIWWLSDEYMYYYILNQNYTNKKKSIKMHKYNLNTKRDSTILLPKSRFSMVTNDGKIIQALNYHEAREFWTKHNKREIVDNIK